MLEIKVLCPCCANCRQPEEFVRDALSTTGVKAEVLKITDMQGIIAHSLLSPSSWRSAASWCRRADPASATIAEWIRAV